MRGKVLKTDWHTKNAKAIYDQSVIVKNFYA
jgi:hypothetical protein